MSLVKSRLFGFFFVSICFVFLYLHNLSQSIYGGDVGDLVTAASLHGVAHPPGYPLFTFLGFFLTRLVPLFSPAWRIGLISGLSGAFGLGFFYVLLERLTKRKIASLLATTILGLSFFYWFYSEIAEVFALHGFFVILLFYLAVVFRQTRKFSYACLLFFVFGLSCTNHQTIIFLVPSLLILCWQPIKKVYQKNKSRFFLLFGFLCLGFIPYVYIPIAASTQPIINWDNVHNVQTFLRLLLRLDYGPFQAGLFDSPTFLQRVVSVWVYLSYLTVQLTISVVVVCLFGFWYLFKNNKVFFFSVVSGFFLFGIFFLFYAGFPLTSSFVLGVYERFFIAPSIIFFISFVYGLVFFSEKLEKLFPKRPYAMLLQCVFFIIPFFLFIYNFPKTDLSHVFIGDTYAKDLLTPLPPHSVLVLSGDTPVFNTWYVHYVLGYRPDVLVYTIGGGIHIPGIDNQISSLNTSDTLTHMLISLNSTRPVFSTITFQPKKGTKIIWVPYGLSFSMQTEKTLPTKDTFSQQTTQVWNMLHLPTPKEEVSKSEHNLTLSSFFDSYSNALIATGTFFYSHYHDNNNALFYYQRARMTSPSNSQVYEVLGIYYLGEKNNCQNVITNESNAITFDPFQELPYFVLYNAYKTCAHNATASAQVVRTFSTIFQKDLQKEAKKNLTNITL